MTEPKARWTDEQVEKLLGNVLRIGVLAAALVVVIGGILYLVRYGRNPAEHHAFRGQPPELCSPTGILQAALSFHSRALIQLGLLLLIATPIIRVALSVFAFLRQRDDTYVALTVLVFAILLYGLFGGAPL